MSMSPSTDKAKLLYNKITSLSPEKRIEILFDLLFDLALIAFEFLATPILVPIRILRHVVVRLIKYRALRTARTNSKNTLLGTVQKKGKQT